MAWQAASRYANQVTVPVAAHNLTNTRKGRDDHPGGALKSVHQS
jgi:hypothetical protein